MDAEVDSALHEGFVGAFRRGWPVCAVEVFGAGELEVDSAGGDESLPEVSGLHLEGLADCEAERGRGVGLDFVCAEAGEFGGGAGAGGDGVGGAEVCFHPSEGVNMGDLGGEGCVVVEEVVAEEALVDGDIRGEVHLGGDCAAKLDDGAGAGGKGAGAHSAVKETGSGAEGERVAGVDFCDGEVFRGRVSVADISAAVDG